MRNAKEIFKKIRLATHLSEEERDNLHDWYWKRHNQITKIDLWLLDKLKRWREWRLSKLQKKVLGRLK